jgi:hypothetical protein
MVITNISANGADLGASNVSAGTGYSLAAGATVRYTAEHHNLPS